ncbi:MAG: hypothetical protein P8075_20140 [Deltaproteobacteria bacterium]
MPGRLPFMQQEEQKHEAEFWRNEYLETWPKLPLGLRRHLARIAPRQAFQIILADGNDEVLAAFLENSEITQAEVLILIDRARTQYLLENLSRTPKWYANHTIKRRLLANPHTPYSVACRILDYLPFVELKRVVNNLNLPREVRNKARETYRKSFQRLSDGETKTIFLSTEGRVLKELTILTEKDKRVLVQLIQQPQVPRQLILNLARSALTPPDVIQMIARRQSWMLDTSIRRALLANGKTPQKVKRLIKEEFS